MVYTEYVLSYGCLGCGISHLVILLFSHVCKADLHRQLLTESRFWAGKGVWKVSGDQK